VITYSAAAFSFAVFRWVIRIPFVGLVNIVAQREVVRELLQDAATPVSLAEEVLRILQDAAYRRTMVAGLQEVADALGEPGCASRVARIASEMARTTN